MVLGALAVGLGFRVLCADYTFHTLVLLSQQQRAVRWTSRASWSEEDAEEILWCQGNATINRAVLLWIEHKSRDQDLDHNLNSVDDKDDEQSRLPRGR
jgi:hypothetical protein